MLPIQWLSEITVIQSPSHAKGMTAPFAQGGLFSFALCDNSLFWEPYLCLYSPHKLPRKEPYLCSTSFRTWGPFICLQLPHTSFCARSLFFVCTLLDFPMKQRNHLHTQSYKDKGIRQLPDSLHIVNTLPYPCLISCTREIPFFLKVTFIFSANSLQSLLYCSFFSALSAEYCHLIFASPTK